MKVEAITFDFWNTMIAENGSSADHRADQWTHLLSDAGYEMDQVVFERAMTDLWSWFNAEWEGLRIVTPEMAITRVLELMDVPRDPALVGAMVDTLHDGRDPDEMQTAPGLGDALESLRSAGLRIGIICDVGFTPSSTLRRYLDHHGLLEHFDGWSFSDEVGCYKPAPEMFSHARASLGVTGPMAHIGDLRRTDIAGARQAGWLSLRYRGFYDDRSDLPDADILVDQHDQLVGLLS